MAIQGQRLAHDAMNKTWIVILFSVVFGLLFFGPIQASPFGYDDARLPEHQGSPTEKSGITPRTLRHSTEHSGSLSVLVHVLQALGDKSDGLRDHGNVVALTDASGIVVERYRYDAYGNATFLSDVGVVKAVTTSDYENPLLFQARNFDPETGLYYFRARYYSPTLGRFLSHDPNGFADSMNLYQYCLQNPVNLSDPSGEYFESPWDIFSIGVGVASVGHDIYSIAKTGKGWGNLALDIGGLAVDVGALLLPIVPGGASVAIKASRGARIAGKAVTWGRRADLATNVGQSAYYGYEAYQAGDTKGMAWSALGLGLSGLHAKARIGQLQAPKKGGVGNLRLRDLSSHSQIGGLHGERGLTPRQHVKRLARSFDPARSAADPIQLSFREVGGQLHGHVSGGQHRILALMRRYGRNARVKDIPRQAWQEVRPSQFFDRWAERAPRMFEHLESLFGGG